MIPVHPLTRESEPELRELVIPAEVPDCVPAEAQRYEHKFGAPRSELYKMDYRPVDEDVPCLIQAAISDELQRPHVEQRLEQLRLLCGDLPASGWVQPRDPRVLLRFLLARQCNVHRAREMLQDVLSWRQQHHVADALPHWEKVKHERFDSYWKASGCTGEDGQGDLVVFERIGQYDVRGLLRCNQAFIQQHCIYSAECVLASLELARRRHLQRGSNRGFQLTVVADMAGLDISFLDPRALQMCKAVARLEADHYPEVLKRIIVVRAPWIFAAVWQLCRPFMDKGSLEKVDIVKDSETTEAILKHVPPEIVPKALGGSMPSAEGDEYCSNLIAPGGKIPEDIIAMTFASTGEA